MPTPIEEAAITEHFLALVIGEPDELGYYGRRDIADGWAIAVLPLTFGRARLVLIESQSDCPLDGW